MVCIKTLLLALGVMCLFTTLQANPIENCANTFLEFLNCDGEQWEDCAIDPRIHPGKGHHQITAGKTFPVFHPVSIFSRDGVINLPQIKDYSIDAAKMIFQLEGEAQEKIERYQKDSTQLTVNFDKFEKAGEIIPSSLPEGLLHLMKNLCCVHTDAGSAFGKQKYTSMDYRNLPLQLSTELLLEGDSILRQLMGHIKELDAMRSQVGSEEKIAKFAEIEELSDRFHQLVPGFPKIGPIFQKWDVREKLKALNRLIHFERAKTLLLSAQFNMGSTNPFEYVYRCLGTNIQQLDGRGNEEDEEEMDMILKYVKNSGKDATVHNIYRVQIGGEDERLENLNIGNRQLLWHGTGSPNMLSILQIGLQKAPLGSHNLFGKGIYLADMFEKSQHYCTTIEINGQIRKYMLLVEAALENVYEIEVAKAGNKSLPKPFNSLKTSDSRYEPDSQSTVAWKERTVALGKRVEKPRKKADGSGYYNYGLDFNDYVVYNPDQVAVRYLIEFEDLS